jgi:hypothetical protein
VKRKRVLALLAALLCCASAFGATLSTDAIETHVGMYLVGNWTTDNGLNPPWYLLGASTLLELDSLPRPWVLGLGLDLLGAWYEWSYLTRRAAPSEPEWGGDLNTSASFFTMGLLVSPRIGTRWPIGEKVAMGVFGGPDLLIRFPLDPFSKYTTLSEDRLPALLYFLAGRFLYPEIGAWLTWQATKDIELALSLRSLWPIWRIWSPEVTGFSTFFHQVIFAGTLGATIRLGKPLVIGGTKSEAPGAKPAAP